MPCRQHLRLVSDPGPRLGKTQWQCGYGSVLQGCHCAFSRWRLQRTPGNVQSDCQRWWRCRCIIIRSLRNKVASSRARCSSIMGPTSYEHRWDAYGLMTCDSWSAVAVQYQLPSEVIANVWSLFTITDKVMRLHYQKPWTRVATSQEEAT